MKIDFKNSPKMEFFLKMKLGTLDWNCIRCNDNYAYQNKSIILHNLHKNLNAEKLHFVNELNLTIQLRIWISL